MMWWFEHKMINIRSQIEQSEKVYLSENASLSLESMVGEKRKNVM